MSIIKNIFRLGCILIVLIIITLITINVLEEKEQKSKMIENMKQTSVAKVDISNIIGDWVVTQNIASARYSTYSKEDIKKLIGKNISYRQDSAGFDKVTLKNPFYKGYVQSDKEFFDWYYTRLTKLGIKNKSIEVVEVYKNKELTNIWGNSGNTVIVKDKEHIIIYDGGEFFLLTRKK